MIVPKRTKPTSLRCILISLLLGICLVGNSFAADKGMYPIEIEQDSDDGLLMGKCPSIVFINEAPQAYYKVYGEWPETFQAIIDAGLIRDNLTLDGVHVITPDDGVLDGFYDRLYIYRGPQTPPQIATMGKVRLSESAQERADATGSVIELPDGSTATSLPELKPLHVYAEQSRKKLDNSVNPEADAREVKYGGNQAVHKLMAIAYMCMVGSTDYHAVYGQFPDNADWDEFVDTGFCPVTSDMLNPLSGKPFSADGSAFSFDFRQLPEGLFTVSVRGDNDDYIAAW